MSPPNESRTALVVVVDEGVELPVCGIDARSPDLALVDEIARVALAARRRRLRVRLRGAPAELVALLELVGLADVLA